MRLKIIEDIGSEYAVSPEDGDKVYSRIKEVISNSQVIILDFSDVDIVTTAFLNNAIGKLYNEYKPEQLNNYIKIENISESDLFLLKKVIERAKITFDSDTKNSTVKEAIEEEFGDE